jgi:hypothetical protein
MAKSLLTVKVKKRKTILPRGADAKHLGEEPSWEDLGFLNESELRAKEMSALNWYNYFYEPKEGRKFILEFMEAVNMPRVTVVMFNRLPDAQINSTTAALSRMYVMGWEDSDKRKKIESRIMDLCRKGANLIAEDRKQAATKANVPQKINTNELITDIEQMIDEESESLSGFYEWLKNKQTINTVSGVSYDVTKFAEAVHLIETLMADRDKLAQIIASMYKWTDKSTDDILKAFKKV